MRATQYLLAGFVIALTAISAAQTVPGQQTFLANRRLPDTISKEEISQHYSFVQSAAIRPHERVPRVADSKFFLLNGLHLGMALVDVEMTQHCIAGRHCREENPLMPSTEVGQLSINLGLVAYSTGISYWLKKRGSKSWWLPPAAGIAAHAVGTATGIEHQ